MITLFERAVYVFALPLLYSLHVCMYSLSHTKTHTLVHTRIEFLSLTHMHTGTTTMSWSASSVREAMLDLTTSLELLLTEGKGLQRELVLWEGVVKTVLSEWSDGGLIARGAQELLDTISQQTTLYCSRLLQVLCCIISGITCVHMCSQCDASLCRACLLQGFSSV